MSDTPEIEFEDLDEYTEQLLIMLYSEPGVGKTAFGASAPRTLIVATERGTISAAKVHGRKYGTKVANCAGSWNKIVATYEKLASSPKLVDSLDWIVIDTATEMHRLNLRDIVETRCADPSAKSQNPHKVYQDEYGEQQVRFADYFSKFNNLGPNVLWLCHAERAEDEYGDQFLRPDIHGQKGKLSAWIAAQNYAVGYMTPEQRKKQDGTLVDVRVINWKGSKEIRAKDRFSALGGRTVDKTLEQITNMIYDACAVPDEPAKPVAKKAPAKKAAPAAATK